MDIQYIPLENRIKGDETPVTLKETDFDSAANKIKSRGRYLAFHPSVLGMAPYYLMTDHFYLALHQQHRGEALIVPDAAVIEGLQAELKPDEFKKLMEFYEQTKDNVKHGREGGVDLGFHPPDRGKHVGRRIENLIEQMEVKYNGEIVRPGREGITEITSGGIIQIGDSIVFAYLEKD